MEQNDFAKAWQGNISCLSSHEARFFAYAEPFCPADCLPLQIKLVHTRNVLENARTIVTSAEHAELTGPVARAALLAALYHDVGRFEQFARFGTFRDADSLNHGCLASKLIRTQKFLDDEAPQVRRLARIGVCLHNRYHLPKLGELELLVTNVVRDADKLDIFRVMAQHLNAAVPAGDVVLHVKNEPECWTPAVAETILRGEVPGYGDLRYINDFRMLLVSWFKDLGFACSRTMLARSGHVEAVLAGLPNNPDLAPTREYLWNLLKQAR